MDYKFEKENIMDANNNMQETQIKPSNENIHGWLSFFLFCIHNIFFFKFIIHNKTLFINYFTIILSTIFLNTSPAICPPPIKRLLSTDISYI